MEIRFLFLSNVTFVLINPFSIMFVLYLAFWIKRCDSQSIVISTSFNDIQINIQNKIRFVLFSYYVWPFDKIVVTAKRSATGTKVIDSRWWIVKQTACRCMCCTPKKHFCRMAMSAEHTLNCQALQPQWWRFYIWF